MDDGVCFEPPDATAAKRPQEEPLAVGPGPLRTSLDLEHPLEQRDAMTAWIPLDLVAKFRLACQTTEVRFGNQDFQFIRIIKDGGHVEDRPRRACHPHSVPGSNVPRVEVRTRDHDSGSLDAPGARDDHPWRRLDRKSTRL